MSGPKHLWSGNWQQESEAASEELAGGRAVPPEPEPTVSSPASAPIAGRSGRRRALPIAVAALLLLAAGAYGLSALVSATGPRASTTAAGAAAGGPAATTATTAAARPAANAPPLRPVNWLGMEIATLPPGAAVIETVQLGSQGNLAGLEPGDVIVEINHRSIKGTSDIAAAIQGLSAGDVVEIQISHGSALYQTEVTLAAPPSAYP